ncbi:NAD(P)H-binding protein [Endozoicomonas gorgoniicola]|uniref:NAD(P)H-binding protein n=1 Tax=Endozoicomonas gorgoniicola TaxID=1234144 RepID=A0ABT3MSW9_9GAMM|nr:NAD(P)H-binding protein [Endozoicomonas gorgoniicola]MCW7552447.1 NAD(P)H-binding protein [Endozoicomonas gorgoniicola]
MNILVTAASGSLGTEISKQLSEKHNVTGAVRAPSKVNQLDGVTYVEFDCDNEASHDSALKSVEACCATSPTKKARAKTD